jgi:hypothetical protein
LLSGFFNRLQYGRIKDYLIEIVIVKIYFANLLQLSAERMLRNDKKNNALKATVGAGYAIIL